MKRLTLQSPFTSWVKIRKTCEKTRNILRTVGRPVFVLPCFFVAACAAAPLANLERLTVLAENNANYNTPIAIDIVFVYSDQIRPLLPRSSLEWFATRDVLIAGSGPALEVIRLQLPPGAIQTVTLPARHKRASAIYSYANYLAPSGQSVGNLTYYTGITLRLGQDSVTYEATPAN